jgi:Chaperone of endosialidase
MRNLTFTFLFVLIALLSKAQVAINTNATLPDPSSMLHVSSTSKGVLFPQVSIDSLKDVTSIASPANGLVVYNTVQPGVRNDMARGYYWYSTNAGSWIRLADNFTDNKWNEPSTNVVKLVDTADRVEILDNYLGTSFNYNPKVKILRMLDSAVLNSKNNITVLTLTGVDRKPTAGWESRPKTTIVFENNYQLPNSTVSGSANNVAISSYVEDLDGTSGTQTNGLAFYVTAPPQNNAVADTPSMSLFRHNVCIGAYATDTNRVTEGRLQVVGFSNGDQLSLRHPNSINLKWGLYVSAIDSSLNFYSNGSLRSNIDRVTGIYTAISDRNRKKNILPMKSVLETVLKLPAYSYNYLDSKDTDRRMLGFMAQDIQPFFPELVYQRYDREITKPLLTMDYSGLGVIAIKAIQEQQKQIEVVKSENDYLKEKIEMLMKRVEVLEKK